MKTPVAARPPATFATDRRGTAAIEFALLAPLYILLLMGVVAYGIYFGAAHSVQQLAADAARVAVAGLDATERSRIATGYIRGNADGYAFVSFTRLAVSAVDDPAQPGLFVVRLQYDARDLPIWSMMAGLPLPDMTIARRSAIRAGGV